MQVTKKKLAAFLIADALVISAGIYVVYRMVAVDEAALKEEQTVNESRSVSVPETAKGQASEPAPATRCEDIERAAVEEKNMQYESGSILVTFKQSVTFAQAKSFLDAKGLRPHTTASPDDFEGMHWLSVRVPKGEEFDWICSLSGSPEVRRAAVNPVFDLAD